MVVSNSMRRALLAAQMSGLRQVAPMTDRWQEEVRRFVQLRGGAELILSFLVEDGIEVDGLSERAQDLLINALCVQSSFIPEGQTDAGAEQGEGIDQAA